MMVNGIKLSFKLQKVNATTISAEAAATQYVCVCLCVHARVLAVAANWTMSLHIRGHCVCADLHNCQCNIHIINRRMVQGKKKKTKEEEAALSSGTRVHEALPEVTVWPWRVHTHMHPAATAAYGMERTCKAASAVKICQKHPAEALIMAGQQSVNHYPDSIELNAARPSPSLTVKYTPYTSAVYVQIRLYTASHVCVPQL